METTDFKVKTEFINRDNGFVPGKWGKAIDLGYSAVKQFSPVSVIRFPSYAKRVGADFAFVDAPPKEAIFYKNNGNIIPLDEFHRDSITRTIEGSAIKHTFDKTVKSVKDTKKRNPFKPLDVAPMPPNVAPQAKPQENIEKPKPFVKNTVENTETTKEKVQAGEGTRLVSVSQNTEQGATDLRASEQEPRTAEQTMTGQRIEGQGTAQALQDRAADELDEPNNEIAGGAAAADEAGSKSFLEAFEAL